MLLRAREQARCMYARFEMPKRERRAPPRGSRLLCGGALVDSAREGAFDRSHDAAVGRGRVSALAALPDVGALCPPCLGELSPCRESAVVCIHGAICAVHNGRAVLSDGCGDEGEVGGEAVYCLSGYRREVNTLLFYIPDAFYISMRG